MWFNCGWMAGWLAGQATLECRVFCLSERGVGQGENAIDDCREEEWTSRKCSLSLSLSRLPRSHSLCLSFPIFFFLCVRTVTVPSLSLLRPQSPGTTTALSCPVNTHTPLLYWVPTFARARETQGHCSYSYPHHCSCLDGVFVWASVLEWWIVFCMCHTSD